MIIDFRFKNYGSFKEECYLSFLASEKIGEGYEDLYREKSINGRNNKKASLKIFNQLGILGANASGKTNILKALLSYAHLINEFSVREEIIKRNYFKLDEISSSMPTEFEINFLYKGIRYNHYITYSDRIVEEHLYYFPKGAPRKIFSREGENIEFSDVINPIHRKFFLSGTIKPEDGLVSLLNQHRVFELNEVFSSLSFMLYIGSEKNISINPIILHQIQNDIPNTMPWIKMADLGIENISVSEEEEEISKSDKEYIQKIMGKVKEHRLLPDEEIERRLEIYQKKRKITFMHRGASGIYPLQLELESYGTNAWMNLIQNALRVISLGGVLIVDEIDASLHPHLVGQVIKLFNSDLNENDAQMIFSTHETGVLSDSGKRTKICPEQSYLVEKNSLGESLAYPISDFDTQGYPIDDLYLSGKLGAIPNIFEPAFNSLIE